MDKNALGILEVLLKQARQMGRLDYELSELKRRHANQEDILRATQAVWDDALKEIVELKSQLEERP